MPYTHVQVHVSAHRCESKAPPKPDLKTHAWTHIHTSMRMSVRLPICLPVCMSICLSSRVSIHRCEDEAAQERAGLEYELVALRRWANVTKMSGLLTCRMTGGTVPALCATRPRLARQRRPRPRNCVRLSVSSARRLRGISASKCASRSGSLSSSEHARVSFVEGTMFATARLPRLHSPWS